jgi:hypothetical protein
LPETKMRGDVIQSPSREINQQALRFLARSE